MCCRHSLRAVLVLRSFGSLRWLMESLLLSLLLALWMIRALAAVESWILSSFTTRLQAQPVVLAFDIGVGVEAGCYSNQMDEVDMLFPQFAMAIPSTIR